MKNKSHKINWAMSLCAVAVFSFTTVREANALTAVQFGSDAPASIEPVPYGNSMVPPSTQPVPPPTYSNNTVQSGSYNGTVVVD